METESKPQDAKHTPGLCDKRVRAWMDGMGWTRAEAERAVDRERQGYSESDIIALIEGGIPLEGDSETFPAKRDRSFKPTPLSGIKSGKVR